MLFFITEYLGGVGEDHTFYCNPSDRASAYIVWMKDSMELIDDHKYDIFPTHLIVNDIIHSDEGSYSCLYMNDQMQNATQTPECLHVYGKWAVIL